MSTSEADMAELVSLTKAEGLCGAVDPERFICTRKAHNVGRHKAILFTTGGKQDEVVAEWD